MYLGPWRHTIRFLGQKVKVVAHGGITVNGSPLSSIFSLCEFVLAGAVCFFITVIFVDFFSVVGVWWLPVTVQLCAWNTRLQNGLLCVEWDIKPYTQLKTFLFTKSLPSV